MKIISTVLISIGILLGIFGVGSYLRDKAYAKASIAVKASVISAEIKPNPWKAIGNIRMVLTFKRDGVADSLEYNYSEAFSKNEPLPTEQELKANPPYVRFIPKEKRSKTIPNWVLVSQNEGFDAWYGQSFFKSMFNFILLGIIVRFFGRKS